MFHDGKLGMEPDAVPGPKGLIHMRVIAAKLGAKIGRLESNLRCAMLAT